ncbi:MAG: UDP-N-acetylglucosamine 2-epimerase (hydrolyzing) [Comamonadaceae bacterium]|nr:UDP-N-acetylglucosamine 2-epimerase (hydrolyzing) [Comamonadaceae bacterium]
MTHLPGSRRKVIYLSGTRADFGLMQSTLQCLGNLLDLSVAVTGTHLDVGFGHTINEIHGAGIRVCGEIPVNVTTRTGQGMAQALGTCLRGLTELLTREKPDVLLLLGDRGEMLAGAIAALHLGIVCVHIHGGERSGTVDEPMRHAISKLSLYHCVATPGSRKRLELMGENPANIVVTGAPGLDGLIELAAMPKEHCLHALGLLVPNVLHALPMAQAFVLVLFHPVVQQAVDAYTQTSAICLALQAVGLPVVWLAPNSDAGSLDVLRALDVCPLPAGSLRIGHLSRPLFCAAMRYCAVMVGNSSAGIIEAATLGTPVVNVGQRQHLRERNANVVDAPAAADAVRDAVQSCIAHGSWPRQNVYGDGRAGERIAHFVSTLSIDTSVLEKVNTY